MFAEELTRPMTALDHLPRPPCAELLGWRILDCRPDDGWIRIGFNARLDSLQCAVVTEKLKLFPQELERRKAIAAIYDSRLANHIEPQAFAEGAESGYGLYTIAIDRRDEVQARLKDDGVPTAIYYGQPLDQMKAFARFATDGVAKESARLSGRVLSLPMHTYMTDDQAHYVAERVIVALSS